MITNTYIHKCTGMTQLHNNKLRQGKCECNSTLPAMFYELIRRRYNFIINTWYQFVGLCLVTCFDRRSYLQTIWYYNNVNKLKNHKSVPLD